MKFTICAITLIMVGCGSSSLVTPTGQGGNLSFDALNKTVQNDEVTISFYSGPNVTGKLFHIEHDSASWTEVESGKLFKVPVPKIMGLSTKPNRFLGGIIGLGGGIAVGGLAGLAIGSGSASTAEHGTWAGLGAAVGAGAGALVGTLVGVGAAGPHIFVIPRDSLRSK
jgi:hypothetical protein